MKVQVIIAAGGTGERMKAELPKPLLTIGGQSIITRTLRAFDAHAAVSSIVLVGHEDHIGKYQDAVKSAGLKKAVAVIPGGRTRTQSVRMGLRQLDRDTGIVIVHDAVRPFVSAKMIDEGLELVLKDKAAVAGVPVKPTLKVVDPTTHLITETLDRSLVWEIQTPQIFDRHLLDRAYRDDLEASDDAGLVEHLGVPVKVYMGSYKNIKITTPEDLGIAESFLKE